VRTPLKPCSSGNRSPPSPRHTLPKNMVTYCTSYCKGHHCDFFFFFAFAVGSAVTCWEILSGWTRNRGSTPYKGMRFLSSLQRLGSRDSVVGIATGYWLDDRGVGVRVAVGSRIFSSPLRPYRVRGPPPGVKRLWREADHSHQEWWSFHYPIHLHGLVDNCTCLC
jgi:hypothetical protein